MKVRNCHLRKIHAYLLNIQNRNNRKSYLGPIFNGGVVVAWDRLCV